jgi:acetoin utilization deacetylase AcuC-like enzyme
MKNARRRTGIFLPFFEGERLKDFPQALSGILDKNNVSYYDGVYEGDNNVFFLDAVSEELLLRVHTRDMIEEVKQTGYYETALYSAGATVQAAEQIHQGHIDNAFAFTGSGDHPAGRDFFGGWCYFNGAALAITALREKGMRRFAVLDTDSHHADGTRDIFQSDMEVLHVCFCYQDYHDGFNNIDVAIPYITNDDYYLRKMRQVLLPAVTAFQPELIFWELGYDATRGDYGDKGLTRDCHLGFARIIKAAADDVCRGRLIAILCGGSERVLAAYIIPGVIRHLAELDAVREEHSLS